MLEIIARSWLNRKINFANILVGFSAHQLIIAIKLDLQAAPESRPLSDVAREQFIISDPKN